MKLKDSARHQGVRSRTAGQWWKAGTPPSYPRDTGTLLREPVGAPPGGAPERVAISAGEPSAQHTSPLDSPADSLAAYYAARRYHVARVFKDRGPASSTLTRSY